jgi:type I restriction enzyme R subunit
VINELVHELDAGGHRLRVVQLTDYTGEQVRTLCTSAEDLRASWSAPESRTQIVAALTEQNIALDHVAQVIGHPDADPFDVLCHLAFGAPLHTRRERADRLQREQRAFFERYGPAARAILDAMIEQYAAHGPSQLVLPGVLQIPAIAARGTLSEIASLFGGAEQLREAVTELQERLYAA